MVTLATRKRKQSHHAFVGNKRTNTQSRPSYNANLVQYSSTTINQQLKSISVTSSAECSDLTDMFVKNQQQIRSMESEIAELKQQHATLLAQQSNNKTTTTATNTSHYSCKQTSSLF